MSLYSENIKQLAANTEAFSLLEDAERRVVRSNPICGDRVTLDLQRQGEEIHFGMEVRGCLICRATASLLNQCCQGSSQTNLEAFELAFEQALTGESIDERFSQALSVMTPLAAYKQRHSCARLPVLALREALQS